MTVFRFVYWSLCCFSILPALRAQDWPRWRGAAADGRWNPPALPADFAKREPQRLWRLPIGPGYGGVTVSDGRVYVMDRQKQPQGVERVLCIDAASGKQLWEHHYAADYGSMEYGSGPRASVTLAHGKAWTLGATGIACCLDAERGTVLWQRDTVAELGARVPQWGFAASPVLDAERVLLHVGVKEGSVVALQADSGAEIWRGGPDPAGYCTPELITHTGSRQLIAWGPKNIQSLDPTTGRLLWSWPYPITYGVSIAQPLYQDGILLVSGYWHGAKALRLGPQPTLLWEDEKNICGLMSAPLCKDGTVFMLDKKRGLQAFELRTGRILWSDDGQLTPEDRNPQMSLVWMDEAHDLAALLNASGELVYVRITAQRREEIARWQVIGKTWAHPAFAGNKIFARDDKELVAWSLW